MSKAGRIEFLRSEAGYTYAALLIVLVALALGAQTATIPTSTKVQRAAEAELIHRGQAYARAIENYWRADPEKPEFPPSLAALIDDPRQSGRRHIRRLVDPVIATEWRLIRAETGGIAGVAPVSAETAYRRVSLPRGKTSVDNSAAYADWEFVFDPSEVE